MNKSWPLLSLLAAIFLLPPAVRAAAAFGSDPPLVRPGPPQTPTDPDRWLPWRVFTWRDGLTIASPPLVADSAGYIWADGPARYDGKAWQRLEVPGETVPEQIWSMLGGSDGSLWLGRTVGGLHRLQGGIWSWYPPGAGIPSGAVNALVEEDRSTVWVGTSTGLARCRDGRCAETAALRGTAVRCLVVTRAAGGGPALWIGTDRQGSSAWKRSTVPPPSSPGVSRTRPRCRPSPSAASPRRRLPAAPRSGWGPTSAWPACGRGCGPATTEGRVSPPPRSPRSRPAARPRGSRSSGPAPSATASSALLKSDGRWSLFDTRSGLPANYVYNLLVTRQGTGGEPTLWVSTSGGLARLDRDRWSAVDSRSGLPNDFAVGLGEATFPDGLRTYWIGTTGGMVRRTSRAGWGRPARRSPPRRRWCSPRSASRSGTARFSGSAA